MIRHNNWMSYSYDGIEHGKKNLNSLFLLKFNCQNKPLDISYKDALYRNATLMRDQFNDTFDLCLSGGIDSEVVVRIFKDLGITHNTFIFRLEENINANDVTNATVLCENLGITYKIVDFNLKEFFEKDAESYVDIIKTPRAGRLPRLKWIELLDNIPIFCEGEPYWTRDSIDSQTKSLWSFHFDEDAYTNSRYAKIINRTAICDWYEFTPEVLWSFKQLPLVKQILNDEFPHRLSTWSNRYSIHKDIWTDIKYLPKLTGFEGRGLPGSMPDFMTEFQASVLSKYSSRNITLTEKKFEECLTSPQEF